MLRVAEKAYPPGYRQPCHAHAETTVTIVLGGFLRERVGRVDEIARPLSIVVKPGGTEHADEFGPAGARTVQIALTDAEARDAVAWQRTLRVWRWTHAGPAVRPFLAIACLLQSIETRSGNAQNEEVERAAYDVLAAVGFPESAGESGTAPRWLRIVREAIDDSGLAPPRVRALAAAAGVHPVYLARQFRRFYGCSVSEYLRQRRLQRTAELMTSSDDSLSSVSYIAGFADQAHMCRVFRASTGITPGAFRALAGRRRRS